MRDVEEIKRDIVIACRILEAKGLVEAYGHISARLPGSEEIIITPRKALATIRVSELITLNLEGKITRGKGKPPLELPMHTSVYRRRPEVNAICRTHSPMALALSVLGRSLRPVHGFGCFLGRMVPVFNKPYLITDDRLGEELAEALGSAEALLLRGNGNLVVGKSVSEACVKAIFLEESALVEWRALAVGQPLYYNDEEFAGRSRMDYPGYDHFARAWDYYRAKYARTRRNW